MNSSDYIKEAVSKALRGVKESVLSKDDHDEYNENAWKKSLLENDLNEEDCNRYDEHRNSYLAGCLAHSAEVSADKFRSNPDLRERNVEIYLGRHDRASAVISREYEDDEGETINNHILIDHTRDNSHLEGVQRMSTAYFSFVNTNEEE